MTRRRVQGKEVGSLLLEWSRRPVGRILRATGLDPTAAGKRRLAQMMAACDVLFQNGRLDVLDAVKGGTVHPMRLLEALRREKLGALPTAEYVADVEPLFRKWAEATTNPHTRTNRRAVLRRLLAAKGDLSVGDLAEVVAGIQRSMAKTPAQANRVREQAMAFVRDILGRRHPVHGALSDLGSLETRCGAGSISRPMSFARP
jgi:hypothetical protein